MSNQKEQQASNNKRLHDWYAKYCKLPRSQRVFSDEALHAEGKKARMMGCECNSDNAAFIAGYGEAYAIEAADDARTCHFKGE